ncbi:unnamed protein product [Spirodela intermedia]|uniref:Uncharacterized protein n=1 Tax=Spirodela intermedia TaxID=51605 RepID=A0A7I8LFT5_SPIIN|nr:unnamed protein product [Spirodela intermedia]
MSPPPRSTTPTPLPQHSGNDSLLVYRCRRRRGAAAGIGSQRSTNSGVARSVGNGPALAWHHGNPWTVVNPSLHGRCRMPESYGSHSNEAPSTASNLQYGWPTTKISSSRFPPPRPQMISGIFFDPFSRGAVHHIPDVPGIFEILHFLLTKENTWTVPTCYRRPPLRAMPLPSNPYDQIADPPSFSLGDHQTA